MAAFFAEKEETPATMAIKMNNAFREQTGRDIDIVRDADELKNLFSCK